MPRRRLPHLYPKNTPLFITFHLHGSVPHALVPPGTMSPGERFVWLDRQMDSPRKGLLYLQQPEIAQVVVASNWARYVVMANHVHLLIRPIVPPARLLRSLKGGTAREANRILGRTGEPLWQKESYDHWVSDNEEFLRIKAYIENNPVKAGRVQRATDFPWSKASVERSLDVARVGACATSAGD